MQNLKFNFFISLFIVSFVYNCNSNYKNSEVIQIEKQLELSEEEKDKLTFETSLDKIYQSINEPNLSDLELESYRFNYHEAFGNHKIYRLERYGYESNSLIVKHYETVYESKNETYKIKTEEQFEISDNDYAEFKKLINGSYFWSLEKHENPEPMYLDGYVFILESFQPKSQFQDERSQTVVRIVPHEGSFRQACEKLIEFYEKSKSDK